jgi:hypothetical protein
MIRDFGEDGMGWEKVTFLMSASRVKGTSCDRFWPVDDCSWMMPLKDEISVVELDDMIWAVAMAGSKTAQLSCQRTRRILAAHEGIRLEKRRKDSVKQSWWNSRAPFLSMTRSGRSPSTFPRDRMPV